MTDVEIKPQRYRDERPKEHFDRYHGACAPVSPRPRSTRWCGSLTVLHALITFRARGLGSENVPGGPVIVAPNHASFMDHFFAGAFVRRRIQFMAKSQLFAPGIPQWVFSHGGVFPVRRGSADEEAFISAYKILERGGAIGMYCEGGRSRNGELAATAQAGIGRLALESGAPVVPVAILGSHQVRNWKRLQFPRVTVSYGEPFRFEVESHPSREQPAGGGGLHPRADPRAALRVAAARPRGALRAARERARRPAAAPRTAA